MDPRVDTLAEALFGSTDGLKSSDLLKAGTMVYEIRQLVISAHLKGLPNPMERFQAQFASKHLDRFIDFLLDRLPLLSSFTTLWELHLAQAVATGGSYYPKRIRTAPSKKVELLFARLVELWSRTCPGLASLFEDPLDGETYAITMFSTLQLSLIILDLRSPGAFSSPSTLPALVRDLGAVLKRCSQVLDPKAPSPMKDHIGNLVSSPGSGFEVVASYLFRPSKSTQDVRAETLSSSRRWGVHWYTCSAGAWAESGKSDA